MSKPTSTYLACKKKLFPMKEYPSNLIKCPTSMTYFYYAFLLFFPVNHKFSQQGSSRFIYIFTGLLLMLFICLCKKELATYIVVYMYAILAKWSLCKILNGRSLYTFVMFHARKFDNLYIKKKGEKKKKKPHRILHLMDFRSCDDDWWWNIALCLSAKCICVYILIV